MAASPLSLGTGGSAAGIGFACRQHKNHPRVYGSTQSRRVWSTNKIQAFEVLVSDPDKRCRVRVSRQGSWRCPLRAATRDGSFRHASGDHPAAARQLN
jgi:hypothetical protein